MGTLVATRVTVGAVDPRYPAQFVEGYHLALYVGAAMLLAGAFVAALSLRAPRRAERAAVSEPVFAVESTMEEAA